MCVAPHYELQLTDEQEEKLGPITTVLKAVDGVKKKLDAISEEIDGIEKVHKSTLLFFKLYIHKLLACSSIVYSCPNEPTRGFYRQSWWGRHVEVFARGVWLLLKCSCRVWSPWTAL